MSAKEKDNNTLSKLKQFFRMVKTPGTIRERTDFALVPELERELQPETPVAQRCAALRNLGEDVRNNRLEDAAIKKLWDLTKDLIVPHKPADQRQTALAFYQKLIQGQYESLAIMRGHFYRVIENHNVPEDIEYRLSLLKTLTDNGKNITYFEESIGKFMLQWMPAIVEAGVTESFLEILVNIIKFNAAYLEKSVVVGIIQHACYLSSFGHDTRTVLQCLQVLDAALCYTVFPTETLTICIVALCRTVTEQYCQTSWRIMKNLLGTNLGHVALLTMCNILSDREMYADETLLRGAVFHINMGLWGQSGSVVPMLRCSPATVLASFRNVLDSQRISVTFEVILSVQRLIKINGTKLSEPSWDVICDILRATANNLRIYEKTSALPKDHIVQTTFHETLSLIEGHMQRNEIALDPANFYALIEHVAEDRPVQSVLHLIEYQARQISATRPEWLQAMSAFVERFYRMRAVNIRVRAVQALSQIMECNRAGYEEEILERVVLPQFGGVHLELDVQVRQSVARMLLEFALHCETKRCLELLDVVERLLSRPLDLYELNSRASLRTEAELVDVIACVDGLVDIFALKLYRLPSTHAIRVFHLLVGHLERHYKHPGFVDAGGSATVIRRKIFQWMLRARANAGFYIGLTDATKSSGAPIRFSNYLGLDVPNAQTQQKPQQQQQEQAQQQQQQAVATPQQQMEKVVASPESAAASKPEPIPAATLSTISIRRGCQRIVECLKIEKDWSIVELVLRELPNIMQNRALLQGNDMESLANTLIGLYHSKNCLDSFTYAAGTIKPSLSEFHIMILTTIASLVPYHTHLNQRTQKEMIESLHKGLFLRNPRVCVNALTVMLLEIPEMILRQLPEVLLQMSKMSSTVTVAVPVLEFLSTLNRLPSHRFVNLIVVHYMYVFAISVPYTNPYKYDHYIVSLAHHVIAGWFLKCRLPLRRNFVNYIIKGFETNVQIPFQEIKKMDFAVVNEDSSNRKRSSSLTEQGSRRRERPSLQNLPSQQQQQQQHQQQQQRPKQQDALYNFHMELAETCIDFLARHTFSPCSPLPKRLPSSEFILSGGQSQTWLVGHNLITITTSGCTSSHLKNGLCDRCSLMCKQPLNQQQHQQQRGPVAATLPTSPSTAASAGALSTQSRSDSADSAANKRYTKASLQHAGGQDSSSSTDVTSSMSLSAAALSTPLTAQSSSDTNNGGSGGPFSIQTAAGHTKFFRQTSNDGMRFSSNSTSGSLEALTRRGSNPDQLDSNDRPGLDSSPLGSGRVSNSSLVTSPQRVGRSQVCACSCTGWAEICIRRPTGNMSWVMRIQNQIQMENAAQNGESVLHDIIGLFMPSLGGVFGPDGVLLNTSAAPAEDAQQFGSPVSTALAVPQTAVTAPSPPTATTTPPTSSHATTQRSVSVNETPTTAEAVGDPKFREPTLQQTPKSILKSDSTSSASTGPIDIPRMISQDTKASAGSFSDPELEDEDETGACGGDAGVGLCFGAQRSDDHISFDDDESRSRNPVRRVNSSPEMSSSWRNPFLSQKCAPTAADHLSLDADDTVNAADISDANNANGATDSVRAPSTGVGVVSGGPISAAVANSSIISAAAVVAAASAFADVEQQRKKSAFGNNMRVSCEAIPEEIAGSTPPSLPGSVKNAGATAADGSATAVVASTAAAAPSDQVTRAAAFAVSSASFPVDATVVVAPGDATGSSAVPKKQLSADDVIPLASSVAANMRLSDSLTTVKLKLPMDMTKVTSKPPQSPTPLSPRLLARNAANQVASLGGVSGAGGFGQSGLGFVGNGVGASSYGDGNVNGNSNGNGNGNGNGDLIRVRSKTISVVRGEHGMAQDSMKWPFRGTRSGISPSSVFLQLYHTGPHQPAGEQPLQIGPGNIKAIALLDLIPPFETHKIGVLYVGQGQCNNEAEMFRNRHGSLRYTEFLRNLGTLVALRDAKEHNMFVNMETSGKDGKFTYIWQDDIVQVTFHVATLMPNREQDPNCYDKKKHIGNDFVTIVYNESGEEYNLNTIKGQFNYACVVVQPLELNTNRIFVRVKDDVAKYVNHAEPKILSDACAPLYARQLALHANLASLVAQSLKTKNQSPYASNWLERLRKIKHLRSKLLKENTTTGGSSIHADHPASGTASAASGLSSIPLGVGTGTAIGSSVVVPAAAAVAAASPWLREDFTSYTQ